MQLLTLLGVALVLGIATWLVRSKRSPVELYVIILVISVHAAVAAFISLSSGVDITSGSATTMSISQQSTSEVALLFLRIAGLLLCFMIAFVPFTSRRTHALEQSGQRQSLRDVVAGILSERVMTVATVLAAVLIVANLIFNLDSLVQRDTYQFIQKGGLAAFFSNLTLPLGVWTVLASVLAARRSTRFVNASLFVLLFLVEFSRSSRSLALLVVCAGVVMFLFLRRPLAFRLTLLAASGFAAIVLLIVVVQLRGGHGGGYGLVPFAQIVLSGQLSFAPDRWLSARNNLLASLTITYLSSYMELPATYLLTSLSPLPGEWTDWYSISPYLSIARGVPSNAIGQIAALPLVNHVLALGFIAVLASVPSVLRRALPDRLATPLQWASVVLVAISTLQFLQYSLRASSRFLWAAVGLTLAVVLVQKLVSRPRSHAIISGSPQTRPVVVPGQRRA
ncbi:hypothetical protein [Herbiconiux solani]|uniref:hypothetical protein n=1 Tax=Herbiconiux solani TaxID=661329 RepID=UPI0008243473|nr:hypothetical protein [Herbiconiux solani]